MHKLGGRLGGFIAGVILSLSAGWAYAAPAPHSKQVIRWVMVDAPPFGHLNGEELTGFFPDMAKAICRQINTVCEFSVLPWSKAIDALQHGQADGMLGIAYAQERSWLRYSTPVVHTENSFFPLGCAKAPIYRYLPDLEGLQWTVGTQCPSDTYYDLQQLQQEISDMSIKRYPALIEAIFAVNNGDITAVYGSVDVIRGWEAQCHLPPLHDVGLHHPMLLYYAWNAKVMSSSQAATFNNAYQKLLRNGKIAEIAAHYHVTLAH